MKNTDHSDMTDRYDPPQARLLMDPGQARLLAHAIRADIIQMLAERPASIKELAQALDRPKGSVGYHVHALDDAGLIQVVRTRRVRAITEKFYGRVARTYVFPPLEQVDHPPFLVEALEEMRGPTEGEARFFTIRHARISDERAAEFTQELLRLAEEFGARPRGGSTVYGFVVGLYPTDRPSLDEDDE